MSEQTDNDSAIGTVQLHQFPRSATIPTASPFGLKLETWLRLHKVPYENVFSFSGRSSKGQVPFAVVNGQEIADSNFIIKELKSRLSIDEGLTDEQKGVARAVEVMLENNTFWSYSHYRTTEGINGMLDEMPITGSVKRFGAKLYIPYLYKKKMDGHGIGRHSPQEIVEIGCDDIMAISRILGSEKEFLFGPTITTTDCYVFAHLVQIIYQPAIDFPQREFFNKNCPNLPPYMERIKSALWPDWDSVCATSPAKSDDAVKE